MRPLNLLIFLSIAFAASQVSEATESTLNVAGAQATSKLEGLSDDALRYSKKLAGVKEAETWYEFAFGFAKSKLGFAIAALFNLVFVTIFFWVAPWILWIVLIGAGGYYIIKWQPSLAVEEPKEKRSQSYPEQVHRKEY